MDVIITQKWRIEMIAKIQVIEVADAAMFEEGVNKLLELGYKLHGEHQRDQYGNWIQVMIFSEEDQQTLTHDNAST